jgi:hypothetical protein
MFRFVAPQLRHFGTFIGLSLSTLCIVPSLMPNAAFAAVESSNMPPAIAQSYLYDEMDYLSQSGKHWIEIDLTNQRLSAWEGEYRAYAVIVSTGKDETPTPTGIFSIYAKAAETVMEGEDYNIPDVPYAMFYDGNYAIHGAYWHNAFGIPISHGCTNVAVDHAAWLYDWAYVGMPVVVHY